MSPKSNRFLSSLEEMQEEKKEEDLYEKNRFLKQIDRKAPPIDSPSKSSLRTALQIPAGAAKAHPISYGLDALKLLTAGASKEVLAQLAEDDPDLLKDVADQARQKALNYFPTQQLAEDLIEQKTGLPLQPKNKLQKALRLGSSAASFRPGGVAAKATAGVVAPVAKEGLEAVGIPEPIAELGGLLLSGTSPAPSLSKVKKPSGLTARQFEKVKNPQKITSGRFEKINESVEKDFKELSENLLTKNRTYSALKEDTMFKDKVGDLFEKVEGLAENIPGNIHTSSLRDAFKKGYEQRQVKGVTPDEFERSLRKEVVKINKQIPYGKLTAPQLVDQFRKNNRSLRELYEPGKSAASNRAKKEALLDYNRAIESVIKEKYPNTEFKDLFEFTNKRWQEINDVEQIDNFMNELFSGKINFSKAKQIFRKDREHISRPFKRILGEEEFKNFKGLTEDLLSFEKPLSNLKKAENSGFMDLAKIGASYIVHPLLAKTQGLTKYGKIAYQMLLDKPKLAVTWGTALDQLKKGNYKEAEKGFLELDKQVKANQTSQTNP